MNRTTPTFHPRPQPRPMTPKPADDFPFPWPLLTSTIDGARATDVESNVGTQPSREPGATPGLSRNCRARPLLARAAVRRTRGRTTPVAPGGRARPPGGGVEAPCCHARHRFDAARRRPRAPAVGHQRPGAGVLRAAGSGASPPATGCVDEAARARRPDADG